mmetsp:Transcript_135/g.119  ORF Transcript_135/g.119 Transcript_135/m.119 type:complete len:125 (-) Transcript_135:872-1246(-)
MGLTAMIRNEYNPFGDPLFVFYIVVVQILNSPIKACLTWSMKKVHLWEINLGENAARVDVSTVNRLDKNNNTKRLVRDIQTNPFRHKFMRVNREWIIHNIALILGGKNYLTKAGAELQYLQAIY